MGLEFGVANNHTVWQPEPAGRGTYGLVLSCVITMVLCVWTAVHLNIPEHQDQHSKYPNTPRHKRLLRCLPPPQVQHKVWWLLLGLFAPEIVAWTAYEQRREAKQLYKEIKELLGEEKPRSKLQTLRMWLELGQRLGGGKEKDAEKGPDDGVQRTDLSWAGSNVHSIQDKEKQATASTVLEAGPESPVEPLGTSTPPTKPATSGDADTSIPPVAADSAKKPRNKWTMIHSHYAIMGGFAFDTRYIGDGREFLPGGRSRVTLTSKGIIALLKVAPRLMPDVSVGEIRDKSKASSLAKTIVTLQASWFVVQCISRMAFGMTVSLLELNTFAHAVCALIAYLLWWRKPLDVEEPTLIRGDDADFVLAGMCMWTPLGSRFPTVTTKNGRWEGQLKFKALSHEEKQAPLGADLHAFGANTLPRDIDSSGSTLNMVAGQTVHGFQWSRPIYSPNAYTRFKYLLLRLRLAKDRRDGMEDYMPLSAADMLRLSMSRKWYPNFTDAVVPGSLNARLGPGPWMPWLHDRARNLPVSSGRCLESDAISVLFSLFTAGLAYGGLHLLAWRPPVRTSTETLIWRISGIAIIAYGAMATVIFWLFRIFDHAEYRVKTSTHPWLIAIRKAVGKFTGLIPIIVISILRYSLSGALIVIAISATLLYTLSRIYLVVECFISVGRLPASVLETPHWVKYLPHVS
ncbi:hypothetical protein B0T25DRAFT_481303 [Lasiosphaeria hispida]|uniref:Uncharacterized protein n=1 Tax=Lasiosphaeria hispida TaxID=260671 RepID=A0AAJ0HDR4_9PEZI|nr:hypothetical protein B0T25DRAFT_481303 [Lasiosphaeria hispida]